MYTLECPFYVGELVIERTIPQVMRFGDARDPFLKTCIPRNMKHCYF